MKPTILIVEGPEIIGFTLCEYFLAAGFEVRFVTNAVLPKSLSLAAVTETVRRLVPRPRPPLRGPAS